MELGYFTLTTIQLGLGCGQLPDDKGLVLCDGGQLLNSCGELLILPLQLIL